MKISFSVYAKYYLLGTIILISIGLLLVSKSSLSIIYSNPWIFIAQGFGILAITLISLNFVLTTRWRFIEKLLGDLPSMYKTHKILGISGIFCAVSHFSCLLIHASFFPSLYRIYLLPNLYWSLNYGKISLTIFVILGYMASNKKIRYDIWKKYHKFMGLAFLFAALHVLTVKSDVNKNGPLKIWLSLLIIIGFSSFIYTKYLYRFFGPKRKYVVSQVEHLKGKVNVISMTPKKKPLRYKPAQFIYISFKSKGINREIHPFTIISSPEDPILKISPKEIGDYTSSLKNLKPSAKAIIWGPYGNFSEEFLKDDRDQLWIAGGIGVTPFISMMSYQNLHPQKAKKWLIYATRSSDDASYEEYLKTETAKLDITLIQHFSNEQGYVTIEFIKSRVPDLHNKVIYICGPPAMMNSIIKQLYDEGIKKCDIISEDFSL